MKRQWFSDAKDLVKWGVLESAGLALEGRTNIVWVAMLTPDFPEFEERLLVPHGVISLNAYNFFRGHERIEELPHGEGLRITPFMQPFNHPGRVGYFQEVCALVARLHRESLERIFLFLDPDTGIRRRGGSNPERYVLPANLLQVYSSLRPGDSLFVYQHAPLGNPADDYGWLEARRQTMAEACEVNVEQVVAYHAPTLTRELAILRLAVAA